MSSRVAMRQPISNPRPSGLMKSHANSDSSIPSHNPKSHDSPNTTTAPRNIGPYRHSVDSGQARYPRPSNQSFQQSSPISQASLDRGQSLSPDQPSYHLTTPEDLRHSPISPSDTSLQESSDYSMDDDLQPWGPLRSVDDDLALRHRQTYNENQTTGTFGEGEESGTSPSLAHTYLQGVPHVPDRSQQQWRNVSRSTGPQLQSRVSPHPLQNQTNAGDSEMTERTSTHNYSQTLRPDVPRARARSASQADYDSNVSDDDDTVMPSKSRRLSSATETKTKEISAPSPNEQAEERLLDEQKSAVDNWRSHVSADQDIDEQEDIPDDNDIPSKRNQAHGLSGSETPIQSSQNAIRGFEELNRDFDKLSVTPTWGSHRRHSFDSLSPSEFTTTGATGVTRHTHRSLKLLQLLKLRGANNQTVPKRKPDPIPTIIGSPDGAHDEPWRRSSEENSLRSSPIPQPLGSPPPNLSEEQPGGTKGIRAFLSRSLSKSLVDQPGLKSLLQQQGGPWAPIIKPETVVSVPPPNNQFLRPQSSEMGTEVKVEEYPSPSGSDVSRGALHVPTLPTMDAFKQHALQTCPKIDEYLLNRVADQQRRNYRRLVALQRKSKAENYEGKSYSANSLHDNSAQRKLPSPPKGNTQWRIVRDGSMGDTMETGLRDLEKSTMQPAVFPRGVPLPPVSNLPAVFQCPWCFKMLTTIKNPSDWTKHVLEDIQPYICTYEDCTSTSLFKRKADWQRHESEKHRQTEKWTCKDCTHVCYRKDNFAQHLTREHSQAVAQDTIQPHSKPRTTRGGDPTSVLQQHVESCREEFEKEASDEPCRFCGKKFTEWKPLKKHLAEHMEQINLPTFVLVEKSDDYSISPSDKEEQIMMDDVDEEPDFLTNASTYDPQEKEHGLGLTSSGASGNGMDFSRAQAQISNTSEYLNTVQVQFMDSNNIVPQEMPGLIDEDFLQYLNQENLALVQTESAPPALYQGNSTAFPHQTPPSSYGENLELATSPENVDQPGHGGSTTFSTFPPPNIPNYIHGPPVSYVPGFHNHPQAASNSSSPMTIYTSQMLQNSQQYGQQLFALQGFAANTTPMIPRAIRQDLSPRTLPNGPHNYVYPPPNQHSPQYINQYQQYSPDQYSNQQPGPYFPPYMQH